MGCIKTGVNAGNINHVSRLQSHLTIPCFTPFRDMHATILILIEDMIGGLHLVVKNDRLVICLSLSDLYFCGWRDQCHGVPCHRPAITTLFWDSLAAS